MVASPLRRPRRTDFIERRKNLGLTQDDVASALNVAKSEVSRFETGKRDDLSNGVQASDYDDLLTRAERGDQATETAA